jgi:acyl carrier protein
MRIEKDVLLAFFDETLGMDTSGIDEETPLFSSGLIDSAALVEIIVFVESEGNVKFEPDDVSLDHLDSIARILNFVASKNGPR